jgi:hypothetical protein
LSHDKRVKVWFSNEKWQGVSQTALPQGQAAQTPTWAVTVTYSDGEEFARVYTDRVKAASYAERQKKSPVVKEARVTEVGGD